MRCIPAVAKCSPGVQAGVTHGRYLPSVASWIQPSEAKTNAAQVIATRYREILPSEASVTTSGPIVHVRAGDRGWYFFGTLLLHIPFLTPRFRLEQLARYAFNPLPSQVTNAGVDWAVTTGQRCHVLVTRSDVKVWFGHSPVQDEAVLSVRPIARAELGV